MSLLTELHENLNSPRVWVKGSFTGGPKGDRHCMVGWMLELRNQKAASYYAASPNHVAYPATSYSASIRKLADTIREQYPGLVSGLNAQGAIVRFNDHPTVKFTDVQRVIEKAIVKEQEEI